MPENKDARPYLDRGPYRHYKGGKYEVRDVVLNKTHDEWEVIYHVLGNQALGYARSYDEFTEMVEVGGRLVPRYEKTDAL